MQTTSIAEVNAKADALAHENPSPGTAIAVVKQGRPVVMKGYGLANLEHDVPVTAKTVFKIASLTKQFTAAAILKLRDAGQVGLDAPLSSCLKGLPSYMSRITSRQLLSHTSGIANYTELGDKFAGIEREDISHTQMLELLSDEPLDFEPGTTFKYSNSGYYLLGMIIEEVSQKPYADFLEEAFFKPLGMHPTTYGSHEKVIRNRSSGYDTVGESKEFCNVPYMSMNVPFAAGALCSTVEDLSLWVTALTSGGVIRPQSFREMTRPALLNDGSELNHGFGLFLLDAHGGKKFVHDGGIPGFSAILSHDPDQKVTIAILTNSNFGDLWGMEEALGDVARHLEFPD